ncbi:MAG: RNA polymerase sigma factor [Spirochaetes bacterium]|nr:RNA polymerase sigma factor [Spirochaetota bacterium]
MDPHQEEEAIARAKAGHGDAFTPVVQAYRGYVYTLILRSGIRGEDADDLFQEVFLRAFRAIARYQAGRSFKNWLCTITLNCIRTRRLKIRLRGLFGFGHGDAEKIPDVRDTDSGDAHDEASRQERLHRAMGALPESQRRILLLCYYERASYEAISRELGLPLGTVKTHLFRAKEALRRKLETSP